MYVQESKWTEMKFWNERNEMKYTDWKEKGN